MGKAAKGKAAKALQKSAFNAACNDWEGGFAKGFNHPPALGEGCSWNCISWSLTPWVSVPTPSHRSLQEPCVHEVPTS